MRHWLLGAASTALLIGCNSETTTTQPPTPTVNGTAPAASSPSDQPLALGLTRAQLEDADLLDANGAEIGEVERVITDAAGTVTGLLVEVEDSSPDRYVTVPLDGLTVVQDGDDRDLRGNLTRDQLMAMPETPR